MSVRIRTTELSQHTSQFAPLPVFSGHFRFAPLGAFYYWWSLVHTPVLYGADVFPIRKIYSRSCATLSVLKIFHNRGRIVRDTSPRATRPSPDLFYHQNLLFEPRVLPFWAPPIFRLRVPNFYCLCGLAPPGFNVAYYCHTAFRTQPRFHFCGIFRPLLRRVPCFLATSFAANLPPHTRQFGRKSPICQATIFPPAHCTLIWRVLCQHSCWLKFFRYVIPVVPVLISWFEDSFTYVVTSLLYLLHCCRKFSLLRRSSGSSDCRIEFVIIFTSHFIFLEKFASGFVPTLIRSNFVPVPIRRGSVLLAIVQFHRRTQCSLVNFNKLLRSISAS